MTEFGNELRRLLAQRGISLSAAARGAGCSKGYLSNAANGRKALTPRVAAGLDQLFGTGDTFAAYALSPPADSNGAESACTQDAAYPSTRRRGICCPRYQRASWQEGEQLPHLSQIRPAQRIAITRRMPKTSSTCSAASRN
jgi:transcriptional regulator with XRE-family HTH domain